jgi:O-acetyl-ADP-ribose deacetylase (regulator of RNase III)
VPVLEFRVADLLAQDVDAIVNAANARLAHAAGVAGAIRAAAGPELEEDSARIGHCPVGDACVTRAGRLPQRAVIHAVGPVWSGGGAGEAELLASAHRAVIARAVENGLARIALPAISTGIFGYPLEPAAEVAVGATAAALAGAPSVTLVRFCFLDPGACGVYERTAARLGAV